MKERINEGASVLTYAEQGRIYKEVRRKILKALPSGYCICEGRLHRFISGFMYDCLSFGLSPVRQMDVFLRVTNGDTPFTSEAIAANKLLSFCFETRRSLRLPCSPLYNPEITDLVHGSFEDCDPTLGMGVRRVVAHKVPKEGKFAPLSLNGLISGVLLDRPLIGFVESLIDHNGQLYVKVFPLNLNDPTDFMSLRNSGWNTDGELVWYLHEEK